MGSLFDESSGVSSAGTKDVDDGDWLGQDEFKPWSLGDEPDEGNNLFDLGDSMQEIGVDRRIVESEVDEVERIKANQQLDIEKQQLSAVLQGKFYRFFTSF